MLVPPPDFHADQVAQALAEHWDIAAVEVSYTPLGAGSHNWTVTDVKGRQWFVKSNGAGAEASFFSAAAHTAVSLHEAGLEFVHASVPDKFGDPRPMVPAGWSVAVFSFIHGRNLDWTSNHERALITEAIGRLHASGVVPSSAPQWTPRWRQHDLRKLLSDRLDKPWTGGPYGERARSLVRRNAEGIHRLLDYSDQIVAKLLNDSQPWVMTHGEPTEDNSMLDSDGAVHLIDCTVMMSAPRERDLWLLLYGGHRSPQIIDQTVVDAYRGTAGPVEPRRYALDVFRAERHLAEISHCTQIFAGPHDDNCDRNEDWQSLQDHFPVTTLWPHLT